MKQEEYDFNFANNGTKEERDEQLRRLKQIQAELTGMLAQTNNHGEEYQNVDNIFDNGNPKGNRQRGNQKTLSTNVGRAMNNYDHQGGFSSALMLGIISFMFEALFLALAIFIYR